MTSCRSDIISSIDIAVLVQLKFEDPCILAVCSSLDDSRVAWHLADLQCDVIVFAMSVDRLVKFSGDVLDFWWRVLLVSRPPALRLLGFVGQVRVVGVYVRGVQFLLSYSSLLELLLQETSDLGTLNLWRLLRRIRRDNDGVHLAEVPVRFACCSRTCSKKKSSEFLHFKFINFIRCRSLFKCRNSNGSLVL